MLQISSFFLKHERILWDKIPIIEVEAPITHLNFNTRLKYTDYKMQWVRDQCSWLLVVAASLNRLMTCLKHHLQEVQVSTLVKLTLVKAKSKLARRVEHHHFIVRSEEHIESLHCLIQVTVLRFTTSRSISEDSIPKPLSDADWIQTSRLQAEVFV